MIIQFDPIFVKSIQEKEELARNDGDDFTVHAMDSGSIDINIKLGSSLNKSVCVIVYATYSTDLLINNQKVEIKKF